jgi:hypothetical protein
MLNSDKQQSQDDLIRLISNKERICLDAYLFNSSNRNEAYKVCKDITKDIDDADLIKRSNNWINGRANKAYLEKYKSIVIKTDSKETFDLENSQSAISSKEDVANQLIALIGKVNDPKLKSELLIKLSDIKGYKKQDQTKQEEQIKYYLPLRCESCSYKNKI